jgi:integrase
LSRRYQDGDKDLRAAIDGEKAEAERQRREAEAAAEAASARARATLGVLLTAYVAQLRQDGKNSAREVECSFALNVEKAFPKLWGMPAAAISDDDLTDVVSKMYAAGKTRSAAKLRAYLRAAYTSAVRARNDAGALPALRALRLRQNPAANLAPLKQKGTGARERALSVAELRAYWRRISAMESEDGALLRLHLLTGAQRVRQLSRLQAPDYDRDTATVTIFDGKGRRTDARAHVVPLLPEAIEAMEIMRGASPVGPYLFSVSRGLAGATHAVAQGRLDAVVKAMGEAGELEGGPFTLGDLRRTVETRLSAAQVSREHRAQLQSHGISGVQAKHYDRHDYDREKRAALETLLRIITGASADVTSIKRKRTS